MFACGIAVLGGFKYIVREIIIEENSPPPPATTRTGEVEPGGIESPLLRMDEMKDHLVQISVQLADLRAGLSQLEKHAGTEEALTAEFEMISEVSPTTGGVVPVYSEVK